MTPNEKELLAVIGEVRRCFNQLKTLAEGLHRDLGVNPSMRAVMEALATEGGQTVPEIAKRKSVSRQHIQTIFNALQADGLVETFANPAHQRSPLCDLTARGRRVFAKITQREDIPLGRLAAAVSADGLAQARKTLGQLNQQLAGEIAAAAGGKPHR
ncbi:MAG: MarR family transcriptional regulator [Proteobacteria bacterium]|nr:MarR family transcriptional regulator [Pseudomonadota bacterium]